ncbi:MAG: PAS domain S-box protein [bacterium]
MNDSLKVLLVEDDLDQAELVGGSLRKYDSRFEIETTNSGDACLERLANNHYEAVILDYHSPEFNGFEILHKLEENGIDTPVVIVSAKGNEQIAVEASRNGAYDYIVKDANYLSLLPKVVQQTIDKRQLETELRESERRYHNIFDKANDAIFIIKPHNYILLEANIKATEISGFSKEELVGKQFMDLYPKDQKNKVQKLIDKTRTHGSFRDDGLSICSKDGRCIPVDINASVIYFGKYKYILGILRNIAEKKHLQSLILNSKKRLQSIFDAITDIIYQVNHDFEIIMANKESAQLCNTQPERLIGKKCYEAYFGHNEPCMDCPAKATFETGERKFLEKNHNDEIFEMSSYPLITEDGEIESVVVYSKNVTEKKRLEKSLIQTEKLATIGLLSSGIAHELRNPLNVIETARYFIQELVKHQDSEISGKLEIIRKNVRRASTIIHNLLEFSRHSEHEREEIDLTKLIESTVGLVGKELTAKGIEFSLESPQDYKAYFSNDSLKQVLLNIIINAVQAMPNGGNLVIHIEQPQSKWIDIKISDTGMGIPEENLPFIFSPFFTTKEVGVGTGLGLYVSHMIIEREGGEIKVDSELGKGTTFTIRLPSTQEMIMSKD